MNTRVTPRTCSSAGHALLLVMCIAAGMLIMLGATMNRTIGTSTMNARNNQYQAGLYAAEAATEKVYAMIRADFLFGNLTAVTNNLALGNYQRAIPSVNDSTNPLCAYWNQFQFSDGQGNVGLNWVSNTMSSWQLATNWGPLPSQYQGLFGWTNSYRIVSNAKQISNTTFSITNACQLDVGLDLIPIFQFAIFYNGLLEFTWCAPFTINGLTHANANIYVGSMDTLTFNGLVTTTGTISSPAWDGEQTSAYTAAVNYNSLYSTNSQALTLPIGTTNVISVLAQNTNSSSLYYNAANLILLVSNSTVTLTLTNEQTAAGTNITANYYPTNYSSTNYVQISTNFPFLTLTNTFTDQRESDTVTVTDINMAILDQWLATNKTALNYFPNTAGVYPLGAAPNIFYAADNRTVTNSSTQLTAVRLNHGTFIPTNTVNIAGNNQPTGFTVATPNPLYVWGMYNVPSSSNQGTTNTIGVYPASLVSDALTILSPNWVDSQSSIALGGNGKAKAVSDTVNAAILTGIVPSTGSGANQYSGGVMNVSRLLEDWGNGSSSVVLTLNTSIVNLFNSARATNQWQTPGVYYYAPTRQFSFNQNFLKYSQQPPGTPMLGYVLRSHWCVPPPNTVTYQGN
ncbi:MAG: hypothetical protein ABSD29_14355 [Verrucomicrobiota bacterium]|jgi:hypothetical protein